MDKKITFSQGKIVGLPKNGKWSQAFSFENLYGVLEIKGQENFEIPLLGKQLIEETQRRYLNTEEKNLDFLQGLLSLFKERATLEISINASLCFTNSSVLYLGILNKPLFSSDQNGGLAKILIKRQGKLLAILKGDKEEETASGFIKNEDRIILQTGSFSQLIDDEELNESLNNRKPSEAADILAPKIQSEEKFGGAGLILEAKISQVVPEEEKIIKAELIDEEGKDEESSKNKILLEMARGYVNGRLQALKEKLSALRLSGPIYIRGLKPEEEKKRKVLTTVAVILIFLLGASTVFNLRKRTLSKTEIKFNNAYQMALKKQEEARALIDLNSIRSRTLLEDGKKTLKEIKPLVEKNKKAKTRLEKLLQEINADLEIVAKVYRLKELPLFFDLTLIKDKAKGTALITNAADLFIYDFYNKSLYRLNIKNKSQEIIFGDQVLKNGLSLTLLNEKLYLLTDKAIYQTSPEGKDNRSIITLQKDKEKIIKIDSFGASLYLLDTKNNRIWKYITTESGLSEVKNYLAENISPDFSKAVSLAIDGAIYVLRSDGEVLKFIQGNPEGFKISGLDISLNKPKVIFTNEDLKNIYLLDSGNNRVVVIDKKGEYQSQYINREIGKAEDLVVDRNEKKIFLLSGSKIYEIGIK